MPALSLTSLAGELIAPALEALGPRMRADIGDDERPALAAAFRVTLVTIAGELALHDDREDVLGFDGIADFLGSPELGFELGLALRGRPTDVDRLLEDLANNGTLPLSPEILRRPLEAGLAVLVPYARTDGRLTSLFRDRSGASSPSTERLDPQLEAVVGFLNDAKPESVGIEAGRIVAENVVNGQQFVLQLAGTPGTDRAPELRNAYLTNLFEVCSRLSLGGVDPKLKADAEARLRLEAVYISLRTETLRDGRDPTAGPPEGAAYSTAIERALTDSRLAILGDPGSGKSTFVNYLAMCLAGEELGHPSVNLARLWLDAAPGDELYPGDDPPVDEPGFERDVRKVLSGRIPVRIVLRDFAARALPAADTTVSADALWNFVVELLNEMSLPDFADQLRDELMTHGGVVLLDGLDEVPDAKARREQVRAAIQGFSNTFHRCRFIVTSRTYAYNRQGWEMPGFSVAVLTRLSRDQIMQFVDKWYQHVGELRNFSRTDREGRAELLKEAITGRAQLLELAGRPLLLTLIASVHAWRGGTLPEKREELYSDAVDLLLDTWEGQRIVYAADGSVAVIQQSLAEWMEVDRELVRGVLNELAYKAHAGQTQPSGTADVPEDDLVAALTTASNNPDVRPGRLIEYLSDRAGLLVPRGVGVYTFPHRTFQEYLAACHLTGEDYPDGVAELAMSQPLRWREVALLAGAKAARGTTSSVWGLVDALCYADPPDDGPSDRDFWGVAIATQLLLETLGDLTQVKPYNAPKLERLTRWSICLLERNGLSATERDDVGHFLTAVGDPRDAIATVSGMQFCFVPAGPLFLGGAQKGNWRDSSAETFHRHDLAYGYWVGRFPVSVAQFREFLDDAGYADDDLWPEARVHGQWESGEFHARAAGDWAPLEETEEWDPLDQPDNTAVWGVSWYESMAFARWMARRLVSEGSLPDGWIVAVPSEPEWEKAGRGGIDIPEGATIRPVSELALPEEPSPATTPNPQPKRLYPWGDEEDQDRLRANGSLPAGNVLGIYTHGASPYGVEELSGGAWEWTRSLWGTDHDPKFRLPYEAGDGREEMMAGPDVRRVLRGGTGALGWDDARIGGRFAFTPSVRGGADAFRVIICPPEASMAAHRRRRRHRTK